MILDDVPVNKLKGIAKARADALSKQGIDTAFDLVQYFPKEYADFSTNAAPSSLKRGDRAALAAFVTSTPELKITKNGLMITTLEATCCNESITLTWFNQKYAAATIKPGDTVYVYGTYDDRYKSALINPRIFELNNTIMPVYRPIRGIPRAVLERAITEALSILKRLDMFDPLSDKFIQEFGLVSIRDMYVNMHYPESFDALKRATRRAAFTEVISYRLMVAKLRERRKALGRAIAFDASNAFEQVREKFSFELTQSQVNAITQIRRDMERAEPMNRLLYGDVGSGKTAVAAYAMHVAANNGCQSVLMAPTDILARQHFATLSALFGEETELLTGSMNRMERSSALKRIASGEAKYIVGTHALIQKGVEYKSLGLVITDEQHRFGVRQRATAKNMAVSPDVLVMSATPIPRTLSLIIYGDLDISRITDMPKDRKPVITRCVPQNKRMDMYEFIKKEVQKGYCAYIVCPHIEEDEDDYFGISAVAVHRQLKSVFPFEVGIIHSKMRQHDKERAMADFISMKTPVLVSTTVVEVGVDAKRASVMVVEAADMFGLAQLHQLRGRVGRSDMQAYCFLMCDSKNERLSLLTKESSGIALAEADLRMRGAGEFLGTKQHGVQLMYSSVDDESLKIVRRAVLRLMRGEFAEDYAYLSGLADEKFRQISAQIVMN